MAISNITRTVPCESGNHLVDIDHATPVHLLSEQGQEVGVHYSCYGCDYEEALTNDIANGVTPEPPQESRAVDTKDVLEKSLVSGLVASIDEQGQLTLRDATRKEEAPKEIQLSSQAVRALLNFLRRQGTRDRIGYRKPQNKIHHTEKEG